MVRAVDQQTVYTLSPSLGSWVKRTELQGWRAKLRDGRAEPAFLPGVPAASLWACLLLLAL